MINQFKEQVNEQSDNHGNIPENCMNSDSDFIPETNEEQRSLLRTKKNEVLRFI